MALELTRQLQKLGILVHVADTFHGALAMHSTYAKKTWVYPSPRFETELFQEALKNYVQKHSIDFVIPTCEEQLYVAEMDKEWLQRFTKLDPIEQSILFHNKETFIEELAKQQFLVPVTRNAANFLIHPFQSESKKYVFKPIYSRFATHMKIYEEKELETALQALITKNECQKWIVQEYLDSTSQYCTTHYFESGKLQTGVTYPSKIKIKNSATLHFKRVDHQAIEKAVRQLGETYCWNGFYSLDWIETHRGVFPIECNVRPTSGVHLFSEQDTACIIRKGSHHTTYETKAIKNIALLHPLLYARNIRKMNNAKDVLLSKDDLGVVFGLIKTLWHFSRVKQAHKINLLSATTYDLEYAAKEERG